MEAGVINAETADRIRAFYERKAASAPNRLFIVFGILGAILVGLGIILIIAHNWDDLSAAMKTFFAFLPLVMGQVVCGYIIVKKRDNIAWRESAATFLFFAIGDSIALVGQVYNIPGDPSAFLATWMLLALPLIYLMNSSVASLLYLCGISYYAGLLGYGSYGSPNPYFYWILLVAIFPFYYILFRAKPKSNFVVLHHWAVPLSVIVILGSFATSKGELMFIAYMSLFSLCYLVGGLPFFQREKTENNGYRLLGLWGTLVLLVVLSFNGMWKDIRTENFPFNTLVKLPEFYLAVIMSLMATIVLLVHLRLSGKRKVTPMSFAYLFFIVVFFIGLFSTAAVVLVNLFVLAIGLSILRDGSRRNHLGIMNFGLLTIAGLIICRFFDTDLSFVIRGLLFVAVGLGFFIANYLMIKKRRSRVS